MTALPFTGAKTFVEWVENTLGWAPPITEKTPRWKAIAVEAGKVNKKIATNPNLYTWEHLALTVEWLRRRKEVIKTPASVLWRVEDALRDSATVVRPVQPVDIAVAVAAAIEREQAGRAPGWQGWVSRLTRAQGAGRQDTYDEWKKARA